MPKWFARLFAVIMILACIATAYYAYRHEKLSYAVEDARVSLETSRARENKQEFEYNQITEAIPEKERELELLLPQSQAALATLTDLRATRDQLREEYNTLQETLAISDEESTRLQNDFTVRMQNLEAEIIHVEEDLNRALRLLVESTPASAPSIP